MSSIEVESALGEIMGKNPWLSIHGDGTPDYLMKRHLRHAGTEHEIARGNLVKEAQAVGVCLKWLQGEGNQFLGNRSSYSLKHYVERDNPGTYIPNGAFIAACLILEVAVTRREGSLNPICGALLMTDEEGEA